MSRPANRASASDDFDVAILGAGCAGLSLAVHLLDAGLADRRVVLIDPRTVHGRDRTWCFFDVEHHPFRALAQTTWRSVRVADEACDVVRRFDAHPYLHLPSEVFYRAALARIGGAPSYELRLGTRALSLRDDGARVSVETDRGTMTASVVLDGRPLAPTSPDGAPGARRDVRLLQSFTGWFVRTERPAFDPGIATLMDFRVDQSRGIHFLYTLPLSRQEALVEDTYFARDVPDDARFEATLRAHLEPLAPYAITHREHGVIPMTTERFVARPSPRVLRIGIAGGLARPATGYAFLAIQRFSRALAEAFSTANPGDVPSLPLAHRRRTTALDRIFLSHLDARPETAPRIFTRLFERVAPDVLARFLAETSSLADDARVMAALPTVPFARAMARSLEGLVRDARASNGLTR